jgi:hypothetical protein
MQYQIYIRFPVDITLSRLLNPNPSKMSFSANSSGLRRKRTTTEHAANNADPLVARKKARESQKKNATAMPVVANAEPGPSLATAPRNGQKTPNDVS